MKLTLMLKFDAATQSFMLYSDCQATPAIRRLLVRFTVKFWKSFDLEKFDTVRTQSCLKIAVKRETPSCSIKLQDQLLLSRFTPMV